jgi:hypothetical protein
MKRYAKNRKKGQKTRLDQFIPWPTDECQIEGGETPSMERDPDQSDTQGPTHS